MITDDVLIWALYWRLKRSPEDGSLAAAIRTHSQICGIISFLFNIHPDRVAEIVADQPPPPRVNKPPGIELRGV